MIDLQNICYCPTLEELCEYVRNPVFDRFCFEIKNRYRINEKIEFSKCSWAPGWNIKFRKAGKSLCTVYPNEAYFTVLVVVGVKEKDAVETLLPDCSSEMREIYSRTQEGNGQKWLMIDIEDAGIFYDDVLRLIDVRRQTK